MQYCLVILAGLALRRVAPCLTPSSLWYARKMKKKTDSWNCLFRLLAEALHKSAWWTASILIWTSCSLLQADTAPVMVGQTGQSLIRGHIDYLGHEDGLDREALTRGELDGRFLRYDDFKAWPNDKGVWLRFRVANNSGAPNLAISLSEVLYTEVELLYRDHDNSNVQKMSGLRHPYNFKTTGFHDIAFLISQQPDTTRVYYIRFLAQYPLLLDGYVSTENDYAKHQSGLSAVGHLVTGLMMGILLYLALIALYVRQISETRYCLAFVATSLIVVLYGRGYLFFLLPHNIWLNEHLYGFIFSMLMFTYLAFSRDHFRTQKDFPYVDLVFRIAKSACLLVFCASVVLPLSWTANAIQGMASAIMIFLCISSVYIWANSERHLTAYVAGTIAFLLASIMTTAEINGFLDLDGITQRIFEFGLCFQATLFSLSLAEKIRSYQLTQTSQAIKAAEVGAESKAKNDFLAKMSHELRTPLNGLLGIVQLLENSTLNDQQRHYTQTMRHSARRLLGVVDDVLDYSRIVSGKMKLDETNFDINELLEDLSILYEGPAKHKNLDLSIPQLVNTPTLLFGDPVRIQQILQNLVGNAIKFTHSGSVTVRTHINHDQNGKCILLFEVEDTGCGIAPKDIQSVIEGDVEQDGTRHHGGSGLGLAICQKLVQLMQGDIQIESAPGYGTLFRFSVEVSPAAQDIPSENPASVTGGYRAIAPKRILIATADHTCHDTIKGYLEILNIESTFATNTDLVLILACDTSLRWDLVLMDIETPAVDGLSATAKIRSWEASEYRDAIPIIALTTQPVNSHEEIIQQAGLDDHISKPVSFEVLRETINKWTIKAT